MKIPKLKPWGIAILLLVVLGTGMGIGCISGRFSGGENRRFQNYTDQIFKEEVNSGALTLHYTLAHPEKYGIWPAEVSLGEICLGDSAAYAALENYEQGLRRFSYAKLTEENKITYDMLLLYFHTLREGREYELLEEVLSPGMGIQAQLPILLAEYTFYDEQDVEDYLKLLKDVEHYFKSVLVFEQAKADAGYFMGDTCLDRILEQCREFVKSPQDNYLLDVFEDNVSRVSFLTEQEKSDYIQENEKSVLDSVIPAYEMLISELEKLRSRGVNDQGLYYYPNGREYYCYLLKTQVSTYDAPDDIRQRLCNQLVRDYGEMAQIVENEPSLVTAAYHSDYSVESPQMALEELREASEEDFPQLESCDYQVKYVHESLEGFLSPAFYLTPPVDTLTPNTIYINQADQGSDLELYTTLGHEGFPGHLYQMLYFAESEPEAIRYLPGFGGYVEGWATYIESYAYSYADADKNLTRLLWLNRSINLCLYSIVDMGVHYYGWTRDNTAHYLGNFGITDRTLVEDIYQAILENPSNYLKYYVGYLNFMDLKEEIMALQGEEFDLKAFHRQILTIGPVQFPVLRKHMGLSLDSYLY